MHSHFTLYYIYEMTTYRSLNDNRQIIFFLIYSSLFLLSNKLSEIHVVIEYTFFMENI